MWEDDHGQNDNNKCTSCAGDSSIRGTTTYSQLVPMTFGFDPAKDTFTTAALKRRTDPRRKGRKTTERDNSSTKRTVEMSRKKQPQNGYEKPCPFRLPTRERLTYTRYQLDLLNGIFHHIRYPNSLQKEMIAKRVGITREQVKVWFQNRRRKEVIIKERSNNDERVDQHSGNTTLPAFSTTLSSVIPSVILVSIIRELKHFTESKEKKKRFKRKADSTRKLPEGSCELNPKTFTNYQTLKSQTTNSIPKNHSIYYSAFDIKSPPNRITPTVAFNLRSDLYRGPLEIFSSSFGSFTNPGMECILNVI